MIQSKMMRARNKPASAFSSPMMKERTMARAEEEWEVRPGGMLVQKRSPDSDAAVAASAAPVPAIRVKVKHESAYYEIYLSAQSTFGELKKLMAERTGVHHQDQKILYKDKERESGAYLDVCGVRDKSKLLMLVDPAAHALRLLEIRRAKTLEKAAMAVKDVRAQVDNLALQVSDIESTISKGNKVGDKEILGLIEQLMTQLIKLDGVVADGDIKLQRGMQVRRVQKYVETLDVLKIKNAKIPGSMPPQQQQLHQKQQPPSSVVVTTEWETFDSLFAASSTAASASTTTSTSTASSNNIAPTSHWQLQLL